MMKQMLQFNFLFERWSVYDWLQVETLDGTLIKNLQRWKTFHDKLISRVLPCNHNFFPPRSFILYLDSIELDKLFWNLFRHKIYIFKDVGNHINIF